MKQPLLLIPIVIALPMFIQVSIKSVILSTIFCLIVLVILILIVSRLNYHLSPNRIYENCMAEWMNDEQWLERWSRRIRKQLSAYVGAIESDFYESGMADSKLSRVEIVYAMHKYFDRYEFEEDLVLTRRGKLSFYHPCWAGTDRKNEWVIMPRGNLNLRREQ